MKIGKITALLAPFNIPNSYNEVFSTDILSRFCSSVEAIPMKFMHGLDSFIKNDPIGTWHHFDLRPDGLWAKGSIIHGVMLMAMLEDNFPFKEISVSWFQTKNFFESCKATRRPRILGKELPHPKPLHIKRPIGLDEASLVDSGSFPGTKWTLDEIVDI